jgi:hypothetical protein
MIQGHVPARVWGFESPLRHQLLTDQRLPRYYLMRPSLRPIFGDLGGNVAASETSQAGHGGAEVFRGKVSIAHRHRQRAMAQQFLKLS